MAVFNAALCHHPVEIESGRRVCASRNESAPATVDCILVQWVSNGLMLSRELLQSRFSGNPTRASSSSEGMTAVPGGRGERVAWPRHAQPRPLVLALVDSGGFVDPASGAVHACGDLTVAVPHGVAQHFAERGLG